MCTETKLRYQAGLFLDMGLHPDRMIAILRDQICITARRGIDAPAGITRFKNDLMKAARKSVSDYLPSERKATPLPQVNQRSLAKGESSTSEMDILMGRIGECVREREITAVIPWLNAIKCQAVSSGTICLEASSDTLVGILEQNAGALTACIQGVTGNQNLQLEIRKG